MDIISCPQCGEEIEIRDEPLEAKNKKPSPEVFNCYDPETNLEWLWWLDGDIDWSSAKEWADNLEHGWTMPGVDDLATFYKHHSSGKLTGGFLPDEEISVWSSLAEGLGLGKAVDVCMCTGATRRSYCTDDWHTRAFAMRERIKPELEWWYDINERVHWGECEKLMQRLNSAEYSKHDDWRMPTLSELETLRNSCHVYDKHTVWSLECTNNSEAAAIYDYDDNKDYWCRKDGVCSVLAVRGRKRAMSNQCERELTK